MYRLALARQGYDLLADRLRFGLDECVSDEAEAWLCDEVCPVVESLVQDAEFRRRVNWPLERFRRGSDAEERLLLEQVDTALVALAERIAEALAPDESEMRVVAGGRGGRAERDGACDFDVVRWIASRPWFALVCRDDFLHPTHDLFLQRPDAAHTQAFRARRELRIPLGDYVTRAMLARVEYWKAALDRAFRQVFSRITPSRPLNWPALGDLFVPTAHLDQCCARLVEACSGGDATLRQACATLFLVYVAYAPAPRLDWLDLPPGAAVANRGIIRHCIRQRGENIVIEQRHGRTHVVDRKPALLCDPTVLRQIAAALNELASFYEPPSAQRELLSWARKRARLVLVDDATKAVYFDDQPVAEGAWDNKPSEWNLLWTLARLPGRLVDDRMLVRPEGEAIRSRRHRLGRLLGETSPLEALIETRRSVGYLLQLSAHETILLHRDDQGRLELYSRRSRA